MRALHYTLNDGTEVKTYAEALASGQKFTSIMREIKANKPIHPKQRNIVAGLFGIDVAKELGW